MCRFIPSRMQQCIFGSQLTEVLPGCHDAREKADPTTTHRPLSQKLKTEAKKLSAFFEMQHRDKIDANSIPSKDEP